MNNVRHVIHRLRTIVEVGDVVYVSYVVYENDIVINQRQHDNLMVGSYNYDKKLEDALIGRCVGEPFIITLTTSDGRNVQVNIIIESINYFQTYELTDQLVQEKYGLNNVEEYYQMCKRNLIMEKEDDARRKAEKDLFLSIINLCEFSVDIEEVAKYSMNFLRAEEDIGYEYEVARTDEYLDAIIHYNIMEKKVVNYFEQK